MIHSRYQGLIPLYALGTLGEDERSSLELHLEAGCGFCRSELERLEDTAAALARATCHVQPQRWIGLLLKDRVQHDVASASTERRDDLREDHRHYELLVPLYALGSSSAVERTELEAHLASGCLECRDALAEHESVTAELASMGSRTSPPAAVGERLKQRIWREARISCDRGAGPGASIQSSDLVGREEELALIGARLDELRRGEGGLVSLEAEGGLGKTRLIEEALRSQSARGLDLCIGRCVAVEGKVSYEPFVDVLRAWAGLTNESDMAGRLEAIEKMVVEAVGREQMEEVFPVVARMFGLDAGATYGSTIEGIEGAALERRIHEVLRTLFAARTKRRPVVLMIEDLHWADQSTVTLLESLLPLIETHALLVIALFRPGNAQTSGRITEFANHNFRLRHHYVNLRPLDGRHALRLARNLLKAEELPPEIVEIVERKGEGNPFFVEEIIRSLVQSGSLVVDGGRLEVGERCASLDTYGTLAELVMSRVSHLDTDARKVLEIASVIGRRVSRRVLEAMTGGGADLEAALVRLQADRFLRLMASRQTASSKVRTLSLETGFSFEHALTQETVLASLDADERRSLHGACAEAIETVYADRIHDFYAVLAYQYTRAEKWEKADEYLFKAGEAAAASAASAEALYFFREGYRVYKLIHGVGGDKKAEARLERNIAMALLNTGNLSECVEHFNAALRLYGEWVPRTGWPMYSKFALDLPVVLSGLYLGSFGKAKRECSDRDSALFELMYNRCRAQNIADDERRMFDNIAAIRHVGHLDPSSVKNSAGILASAGAFFAFSGLSFGPSRRFLAIAEKLANKGSRDDRFLYKAMAFVVRFFEGDWSDEHDIDADDFEYGLRHGLLWDADVYLGMNCERNIHQGQYELAEQQIAKSGELCDRWSYEFARSNELGTRAHLLVAQRRLEEAREAAIRWHEVRNEDQIHVLAQSLLAKVESLSGNPEAAAEALARAETVRSRASGLNFPFYSGAYLTSRLLFDLQALEGLDGSGKGVPTGLSIRARRDCRQAVASARKIARDTTETFRLAARLYWLLGNGTQAFKFWERALESGQRLGERAEVARICRDLWRSLDRADDVAGQFRGTDAEGWLRRARDGFVALGAERELAEIDELRVGVRAA